LLKYSKNTAKKSTKFKFTFCFSYLQEVKKLFPHLRHSYFDVVVGLAWSNEPESYVGGSRASVRGSHAGQGKGDDPD
jgi:hypothetical protein